MEYCIQHGLHRSPAFPEQVIIFSKNVGQGKSRPWCGLANAVPRCQVDLVSEVAELYQILFPTWARQSSETTCSTCSSDQEHSYKHYRPHAQAMPTSPSSGASFLSEVQVRQQRTKQEDTLDRWRLLFSCFGLFLFETSPLCCVFLLFVLFTMGKQCTLTGGNCS